MLRLPRRVVDLFRISMLIMLMAGIVGRPVLNQIAQLHAIEHAAQVAQAHGHVHCDARCDTAMTEPQSDPDHMQGGHGFMHQADLNASSSLLPSFVVRLATLAPVMIPSLSLGETPQPRIGSPFRPPIG